MFEFIYLFCEGKRSLHQQACGYSTSILLLLLRNVVNILFYNFSIAYCSCVRLWWSCFEGWRCRVYGRCSIPFPVAGVALPGFRGPRVLPRLEDRGQPPFLHELEAGNVGGSREGSRTSPLGPHAGLQGLHSYTAAVTHRLRPEMTKSDGVAVIRWISAHVYQH